MTSAASSVSTFCDKKWNFKNVQIKVVLGSGFAGGDVWTSANVWEARHYAPKFAFQMMEQYRVQRGEKLGTRLEQIGSNKYQVFFD